jgi:hypothetical protein
MISQRDFPLRPVIGADPWPKHVARLTPRTTAANKRSTLAARRTEMWDTLVSSPPTFDRPNLD